MPGLETMYGVPVEAACLTLAPAGRGLDTAAVASAAR
jgi:hypothetical protein